MRRLLITLGTVFALSSGGFAATTSHHRLAQAAGKASVAGIPLPPRARIQADGTYRAAQSYRKTVIFFERYLRRQGISHQPVPTYQVRGVQVTRFLSEVASSKWMAIHVYKIRGMTHVFIVPRLAITESGTKE